MKKAPFKMKGFSGFGNSITPIKKNTDFDKMARENTINTQKLHQKNEVDMSVNRINFKRTPPEEIKSIQPPKKNRLKPKTNNYTPPPPSNNKNKGTLKGITGFEYDFPKTNKLIKLHNKIVNKGINTIKKGGNKIKDYLTKK